MTVRISYSDETIRGASGIVLVDDRVSPPVRCRIAGDDFIPPFVKPGAPASDLRDLEIPFDSTNPEGERRLRDWVTRVRKEN